MKINRRLSTQISIAACVIAGLIFAAMLPILPKSWEFILTGWNELGGTYCLTLSLLYAAFSLGITACVLLLLLLRNVLRENVFCDRTVAYIRFISWLCFGAMALFYAVSYFHWRMIPVAFACMFLGLVLRVVKNVIEEATAIKNENDLTV